jgi:copper chaperone
MRQNTLLTFPLREPHTLPEMTGAYMTTFSIPDMNCGHCKAAVTAAIAKLDPDAQVVVDLVSRRATVTTVQPPAAVIAALATVGFPAKTV